MSRLQKIGEYFESDKAKNRTSHYTYLEYYENIFKDINDETKTVFEIGTYYGNGILTLSEYFANAQIISIDKKIIDVVYSKIKDRDNCFIYECDQTDRDKLLQIVNKHCECIDIIIDDASHEVRKTIETFEILYPKLKKGGYYIIEDLQCTAGTTEREYTYDNNVNVKYHKEDLSKLLNFILQSCQNMLNFTKDSRWSLSEIRISGNILVIKK